MIFGFVFFFNSYSNNFISPFSMNVPTSLLSYPSRKRIKTNFRGNIYIYNNHSTSHLTVTAMPRNNQGWQKIVKRYPWILTTKMLIKDTGQRKKIKTQSLWSSLKISVGFVNMFLWTILLQKIQAKDVCFRQRKGKIIKLDLYHWCHKKIRWINSNL